MSEETSNSILEKAERLVHDGDYRAALDLLQEMADGDTTGSGHALMGLACCLLEDYPNAVGHYTAALERSPGRTDWRELMAQAQANAVARIDMFVPPIDYFVRDSLLLPADRRGTNLPHPTPARKPMLLRRLFLVLGNGLGAVGSFVFWTLAKVCGQFANYRRGVWTNWYHRCLPFALLTLAHMRDELNCHNLKRAYSKGQLTGLQVPGQIPPPGAASFRTADGSWNNLQDPMEGAAGTRFSRNVTTDAIHPKSDDRLLTPNPRDVSRKLLTRGESMKEADFLNLFAAAWIQFQTHDWVSHGENVAGDTHTIPLSKDDELRRKYRRGQLFVGKTQPDPTTASDDNKTPVTFINEVTHWWDGSQIYGSDQGTQDRLRARVDGKLKVDDRGRLPLGSNCVEATGFNRNWWVGLSLLHTLFVKEHNAISSRLRSKYPHWDDDRLFNVARLINAAVMAKIHTVEWTPAILPNAAAVAALNANWFGLATNFLRPRNSRKTLSEINIRNPELGGVVGNPIDKHGVPFSLTEEFVEVYRLHSLLPETLEIKSHRDNRPIESVPLPATRQAGSRTLMNRVPMEDLLYSFGNQHPGALELNNYPKFMQELSMPGNPLLDLGAVDILRARERGVPRYNEFRRQLQLKEIRCFEDLTDDEAQIGKLKEVYGNDVEALDLLIGTLAEAPSRRPTGFGFGETLFQIFILNATRRLQSDRFYTTCYNADTYTPEGLDWIDDASFKTVLLRHHPELAETGLANIRNAFEPWDATERLDCRRHPLRAFDKELKPDPWLGDLWR